MPTVAQVLAGETLDELRAIAERFRLPTDGTKAELCARIHAHLHPNPRCRDV